MRGCWVNVETITKYRRRKNIRKTYNYQNYNKCNTEYRILSSCIKSNYLLDLLCLCWVTQCWNFHRQHNVLEIYVLLSLKETLLDYSLSNCKICMRKAIIEFSKRYYKIFCNLISPFGNSKVDCIFSRIHYRLIKFDYEIRA